jgi:transcriptional regulator with XRE-family HTH domain
VQAPEQARRVRAARAYAGYSRARLAAATGLSVHSLTRLERGEREAPPAELSAIAETCGVVPDFFEAELLPSPAPAPAASPDLVAQLRELREKLDRFLEPPVDERRPGPVRDESAELLDALDPSFEGLDHRLIRAIENPLRMRLLAASTVAARTPKELSHELGVEIDEVADQLEVLVRTGAVQRVLRDGEPAYQAIVRDFLDDRQWAYFPVAFRRCRAAYILDLIQADVRASMPAGGFDPETVHVSRSPLRLDGRGYEEVVALLKDVLLRALQINAESDARRTYGESEEEIETSLAILHFHRQPRPQPAEIAAAEQT